MIPSEDSNVKFTVYDSKIMMNCFITRRAFTDLCSVKRKRRAKEMTVCSHLLVLSSPFPHICINTTPVL